MRVDLVAPSRNGAFRPLRKGEFPPLGLLALAAYTPPAVQLRLIDENVERLDLTDLPDLVGITTMTATVRRAYEIAGRYRAQGVKVVLGGVHASLVPEEALQHADSVVVGEAEALWPQVIADAEAGSLQRLYRQESPVDYRRPLLPCRELVKRRRYWWPHTIQTARGCPHDCSFCSVTAFNGRRYRPRELDHVLAEVEPLATSGSRRRTTVAFVDDNIAANPQRAKQLFQALIPLRIWWGSQACITFARDEELVGLAAESGCRFLFIGLETVSSLALAEIGKHQNKVGEYEEALRRLRQHGIQVMGSFVFGFDSDDEAVFEDTLQFAQSNRLPLAHFVPLTPYPGTRLYRRLLEESRVDPGYWLHAAWEERVVFQPARMGADRLDVNTRQVRRKFYSYGSIIQRIPSQRFWYHWLIANLIYRHFVYHR